MTKTHAQDVVDYATAHGVSARIVPSGDHHYLCYMVALPEARKLAGGTDWHHVNRAMVIGEIERLAPRSMNRGPSWPHA